jgi:shingomyelin synthase
VTGVLTLLFSRGHYSIDVVIAYWITTRLWWMYHTLANNPGLVDGSNKHNYLSNVWWWYIFRYFEIKVGRPLPKRYNWPLPKKLLRWRPSAWRSGGSTAAANRDARDAA